MNRSNSIKKHNPSSGLYAAMEAKSANKKPNNGICAPKREKEAERKKLKLKVRDAQKIIKRIKEEIQMEKFGSSSKYQLSMRN